MRKGETLGLVGESGSGKSVTRFDHPAGAERDHYPGRILFQGATASCPKGSADTSADGIGFVFQEPMARSIR